MWLRNWENILMDKYLNSSLRINCRMGSSMRWSCRCCRSKFDQHNKMNLIVHIQGEIRRDFLNIKSNMWFMYKSIIALISSSMDENLNKFREKFEADIVEDSEPIVEVSNWYTIWFPKWFLVDIWNSIICFIFHVRNVKKKIVDSKGNGKMAPTDEFEFPYILQLLFFHRVLDLYN